MISDGPEEIYHLRRLAARLRSLAMTEPSIAGQLRQIADEADDRADAMVAPRLRPRTP
jgi:glutamyl-tRNA reductase